MIFISNLRDGLKIKNNVAKQQKNQQKKRRSVKWTATDWIDRATLSAAADFSVLRQPIAAARAIAASYRDRGMSPCRLATSARQR